MFFLHELISEMYGNSTIEMVIILIFSEYIKNAYLPVLLLQIQNLFSQILTNKNYQNPKDVSVEIICTPMLTFCAKNLT